MPLFSSLFLSFLFLTLTGWATDESSQIQSESDYLNFNTEFFQPKVRIEEIFPDAQVGEILDQVASSPFYLVQSSQFSTTLPVTVPEAYRIGTYNVLYDGFLFYNQFDKIDHFDWSLINPQTRRQKVVARIESLQADMLCTQEMSQAIFTDVLKAMPHYSGVYLHAQNKDNQGVALFFDAEKFSPLALDDILGKNNPHKTHKGIIYVPLSFFGEQVIVACGHLPWYESSTRSVQADIMQQEDIRRFFELPEQFSNIKQRLFLGDFNATAETLYANLLQEDKIDVPEVLLSNKSYSTCFDDYTVGGTLYSVAEKIDHIFYQLKPTLTIEEDSSVTDYRYISNFKERQVMLTEYEPSDHLPVVGVLSRRCN